MEAQKANENLVPPVTNHKDAVAVDGLDDLFQWASGMVADSMDVRTRKDREQRIRRNVLEVIHKHKEHEAQEKFGEEVAYLHRRVIALLQALQEKTEEVSSLKQIMVAQYFNLRQLDDLEKEVKQLRSMTWYREEAEEERKALLTSLSKLKKDRDFLEDLLQTNETENERLARLLLAARADLETYRNRTFWQRLGSLFNGQ